MAGAGSSWRIATFRPGEDPIGNLAGALDAPDVLGVDGDLADTNRVLIDATLRRSSRGLVDAVRQARYRPFLLNGQPTEVQTTITIVFRMDG